MDDQRLQYIIEKHLDGSLTADESEQLDALMKESPALSDALLTKRLCIVLCATLNRLVFPPLSAGTSCATSKRKRLYSVSCLRQNPLGSNRFFQTRVMQRLAEEEKNAGTFLSQAINEMISRLFPRVAIPAFAAASLVMAGNVGAAAAETPFVDALFGLPSDAPSEITALIWEE